MTKPLPVPPKKDPQKRTIVPTLPPMARSRAALGLGVAAAQGRFMLQHCDDCGAVQYPPRDACAKCLSVDLNWRDVDASGQVLATTTIRASPDPYFRERLPWRMGSVKLAAGPVVVCHLLNDVARGDTVTMTLKLDKAGQGVMIALLHKGHPDMQDDPVLRAMSCDPKHRRILITDGRAPVAQPLAHALLGAGAASVIIGEPEAWLRWEGRDSLAAMDGVEILPLDVTDTASVARLAAETGGKTDILINTATFTRPGGVTGNDTIFADKAMDVNVMGLMRLAQAFGPGMGARTADGGNASAAFVNILSVQALVPDARYGCFGASQAAARSVTQTLRAEYAQTGLRFMNVFTGPIDDAWHQPLPPPKVAPSTLARAVVTGLQDGLEDVCCGDVAKDIFARWQKNAPLLEREATGGML